MKWYLEITTVKGTYVFPYKGYETKREALAQKDLADKEPQNLAVKLIRK